MGDPISDLIREQINLLEGSGEEAAFEGRPPGVEISFEALRRPAEVEARGWIETYRERQHLLLERAERIPRSERIHYYAVELRAMKAYMERDVRADAQRITSPTLVLHGSDDREVAPALGEKLARTIPGAQLCIVPGGGHSLMHRTKEGRSLAIAFIDGQEATLGTRAD